MNIKNEPTTLTFKQKLDSIELYMFTEIMKIESAKIPKGEEHILKKIIHEKSSVSLTNPSNFIIAIQNECKQEKNWNFDLTKQSSLMYHLLHKINKLNNFKLEVKSVEYQEPRQCINEKKREIQSYNQETEQFKQYSKVQNWKTYELLIQSYNENKILDKNNSAASFELLHHRYANHNQQRNLVVNNVVNRKLKEQVLKRFEQMMDSLMEVASRRNNTYDLLLYDKDCVPDLKQGNDSNDLKRKREVEKVKSESRNTIKITMKDFDFFAGVNKHDIALFKIWKYKIE